MNSVDMLNSLMVGIGVPSIIMAFIYVGKKLQVLDLIQKDVGDLTHNIQVIAQYLIRHHDEFDSSRLK